MHEMMLCESILKILEEEAALQHFERVTKVHLELGVLAHISPESMLFCFDAVTRGTLAEEATLEISRPPGEAWCETCARCVTITRRGQACPACGNYRFKLTAGEEMKISALEVE